MIQVRMPSTAGPWAARVVLRGACAAALCAAVCGSVLREAQAANLVPQVVFHEPFDTPTADAAETALAYPDYTFVAPDLSVTGGILEIDKSTTSEARFLTIETFTKDTFTVLGQVGGRDAVSAGNVAVGMAVGNRGFVFFPDLSTGAFRVVNPLTGGTFVSNTNMGFTPVQDVLHQMIVDVDSVSGILDITVIDGVSAAEFNFTYDSGGAFVPGTIGFIEVYSSTNIGMFDNLQVVELVPFVPEPSTLSLCGLGLLASTRYRRRLRSRIRKSSLR